jgi:hypothetical protein
MISSFPGSVEIGENEVSDDIPLFRLSEHGEMVKFEFLEGLNTS